MMNDKELLELAAKAAGIKALWAPDGVLRDCTNGHPAQNIYSAPLWNPLTDNGDALRLAVKLHINIEISNVDDLVRANRDFEERYTTDPYAAIRRAIVRAAAEIGKEKK
tara:strand:+ start:3838 stop:4164 length:327 start_codon:yes stop_codon:yes gene_type:complete